MRACFREFAFGRSAAGTARAIASFVARPSWRVTKTPPCEPWPPLYHGQRLGRPPSSGHPGHLPPGGEGARKGWVACAVVLSIARNKEHASRNGYVVAVVVLVGGEYTTGEIEPEIDWPKPSAVVTVKVFDPVTSGTMML